MVEKTVNIKVKASLQPPFGIREIDSRYLRGYMSLVKKDKDNANWEYQDKDKDKAKFHNLFSANTSQPQTQASKKDKRYRRRQGDYSTTRVNAIKISKKDKNKDKAKDLSYIEYYICKQKGHHTNKCSKKSKN